MQEFPGPLRRRVLVADHDDLWAGFFGPVCGGDGWIHLAGTPPGCNHWYLHLKTAFALHRRLHKAKVLAHASLVVQESLPMGSGTAG